MRGLWLNTLFTLRAKPASSPSFRNVILFNRFFTYFLFVKRVLLSFFHRNPLTGDAPGGNTP